MTYSAEVRRCPCCRREEISVDRVLCGYCFYLVPFSLRADLVYSHKFRVQDPASYEETLIRLYEWRNEAFKKRSQ